ncbi:MAG: hypothetical protein FRX49_05497 [Trebouxia sp. A1-2]|nr:MAG: hypothetical protein FRX49_05497 [Trebouxia sp. A1-2]
MYVKLPQLAIARFQICDKALSITERTASHLLTQVLSELGQSIGKHEIAAAMRVASDLLLVYNRGSSEADGPAPPQSYQSSQVLFRQLGHIFPHSTGALCCTPQHLSLAVPSR